MRSPEQEREASQASHPRQHSPELLTDWPPVEPVAELTGAIPNRFSVQHVAVFERVALWPRSFARRAHGGHMAGDLGKAGNVCRLQPWDRQTAAATLGYVWPRDGAGVIAGA